MTHYDYLQKQEEAYRNNKIKSLIDLDEEYVSSLSKKKQNLI